MPAKQWCYYFLYSRTGDAITQAEQRQKRYDGLIKWRMQGILEQLPVLTHLSLALFSIGLVLYLWSINVAVASIVTGVSLGTVCFYLGTTLIPVGVEFCPYKTPQAVYTKAVIAALLKYQPTVQTAILNFKERLRGLFHIIQNWVSNLTALTLGFRENDPHGFGNMSSVRLGALHRIRTLFMAIQDSILGFIGSHIDSAGPPNNASMRTEPGAEQEPDALVENTNGGNRDQDRPDQQANESDDNTEPFVKDALTWLILNSQNSDSIDVAIGALAVGKVKLQDEGLKNRVNSHLIKHFSDCFHSTGVGVKLQLQSPESSLPSVLDYVNWMSYFAGGDLQSIATQVQSFNVCYGIQAVTHLGLALASLAEDKRLSPDVGRKVVLWLSSFIKNYEEGTLYLNEEVLPVMIDGLTVTSLHYHPSSSERHAQDSNEARESFQDLAIPHLTEILWKVSHIENSPLRSSIGLNLVVFALKANLYYPADTKSFESAAEYLAHNYRSSTDRNNSFVSFVVFALLGILHPRSDLELDHKVTDTICSLIRETSYLDRPGLVLSIPHVGAFDPLGRRLTAMLVETMVQARGPALISRIDLRIMASLGWDGFARLDVRELPSVLHAVCSLITMHVENGPVLKEDALVAATDLLFREVKTLTRLDHTIIEDELSAEAPHKQVFSTQGAPTEGGLLESPGNDGSLDNPLAEKSPEQVASYTLALVMQRSENKQCIETAVRAVLCHSNRCDVDLVVKATRWFEKKLNEWSETEIQDRILNVSGYARILTSMALHCLEPTDLAGQICGQDSPNGEKHTHESVAEKIKLLAETKNDAHIHAFGVAALAIWRFACPNKSYMQQDTDELLAESWGLILEHTKVNLRPEALEALIDTTVLFAAVTEPACAISHINAQALLRLLAQFESKEEEHVRPALAVAMTFWGLSLDKEGWDFWPLEKRKDSWRRIYTRFEPRKRDQAALFLLGLSRFLENYTPLRLDHRSIRTIATEIDHYMQQHSGKSEITLALPFLPVEFDVRRHVRTVVALYLKDTESHGPFPKSVATSRNKLLSALQVDGGEGFQYEVPQPFARDRQHASVTSV
ncbi:hypothetical protein FS749_009211 [Ceratobasidium sp. UAMH 11750]|nr:hypothetical protein FS749_009211 [Ceratobasidium sp. UAMH 11750]